MRTLGQVVALVALAGLSLPAHADPKDDARRHFVAGLQAARDGQFELALDEFLAAQSARPHPATLYNIARAYGDLGDLPKAVEYYRLFQAAAPDKADDVAPVIAVLEARMGLAAGGEVPVGGSSDGGGAATADELARLTRIAGELAALADELKTRVPADSATSGTVGPVSDGSAVDPSSPPAPAPLEAPFLADAYERVVVTASRYGQDPIDSPSTVTVLTADDIRLSGATDLPTVLRQVVGVDVMSLSGAHSDVSIRGFNRELSNKVLVLVDGRSVYLDFLGTVLWALLPIQLEEIERVEIIRGPGSAVYGANAVTGVINIITRNPGTGDNIVLVEGGRPDYGRAAAVATGRDGPTAWRLSAGYQQHGRWSQDSRVVEDGAIDATLENQDRSREAVQAALRVDRSFGADGLFSLSGGWSQGFTEFHVFGALGDYAMPYAAGNVRTDVAVGPVHLRMIYDRLRAEAAPWLQATGARDQRTPVDSDTFDTELEGSHSFDTGPISHRLNGGVGYRYKGIEWGYLAGGGAPIVEHHASAFLSEEAKVDALTIVGSLRADRHPLVPLAHTISPRGTVLYRVADRTAVRATAGSAFRAPSQMESYTALDQPTSADGLFVETLGDVELLPERIFTGEVGVHDESTSWHRADLALYVNRVSDLIFVQDLQPALSAYDAEAAGFSVGTTSFGNLEEVYTAWGGEADTRFFPADGLDLYANVALQRTFEEDAVEVVVDGSTSAVKANVGVMYRSPARIDLSTHLHYLSAQTWRLREYDANGQLVVQEAEVPARTIPVVRLAARPLREEQLEFAVTAWNIPGLLDGGGVREHPKGQIVSGRLYGTASWSF